MEASAASVRPGLAWRESIRRAVSEHPGTFLAVAGLTALAAAIRFSSLGVQAYHHDELVTAKQVIHSGLIPTLQKVHVNESTPPLYYILAWGWAKFFGIGEWGLRSLSALFGVATIPIAYWIGREAVGRRAGVALAGLVAVNPMLIWYSQETRAYALLVLLSAAALLFFLRSLRTGRTRDITWWAILSALALLTHYFAAFPFVIEAAWLFLRRRDQRAVLWAIGAAGAVGAALIPLAAQQATGAKHTTWIVHTRLLYRLWETTTGFFIGETGRFLGEPIQIKYAIVPMALSLVAVILLLLRGGSNERRGARIGLVIGGGAILIPLILALGGEDFILARNLLPSLIPLGIILAAAVTAPRAGVWGATLAAVLLIYWLAFDIYVDYTPSLQRVDWRAAAQKLGPPHSRRVIVTWKLGGYPLAYYLHEDLIGTRKNTPPQHIGEIDVIWGRRPPPAGFVPARYPKAFKFVQRVRFGRLTMFRYETAHFRPVKVTWKNLVSPRLGWRHNTVLIDKPTINPY